MTLFLYDRIIHLWILYVVELMFKRIVLSISANLEMLSQTEGLDSKSIPSVYQIYIEF